MNFARRSLLIAAALAAGPALAEAPASPAAAARTCWEIVRNRATADNNGAVASSGAAIMLGASALADGPRMPRAATGSLESVVVGKSWRREAGDGPDIELSFEGTHRLIGSVTIADRVRRTLDTFTVDWTWIIRGDRIDIGGGRSAVDCRIAPGTALQAFVLSDCHPSLQLPDLSGTWRREKKRD